MEATATTETMGSANPMTVDVELIDVDYNPRTKVDTGLLESIRAMGVLTPLLLRPKDDGRYELVAGGRRFAAIKALNLAQVPALVREMDDAGAARAALAENVDREALHPLDEAEAASRILGQCKGDREEAARLMGWKRELLDRRLGLMACNAAVRDALRKGDILLGHAELLAGLRQDKQDAALSAITTAAKRPSVEEFRSMIERMALDLAAAIFNKDGCRACPHNSGIQRVMFSEAIGDNRCTNRSCYEAKTQQELDIRAERLRETYQQVRIVRPGDNHTVIALRADGARGVGVEQAKACRSCANFGAVVSGLPNALGEVYTDRCMDTVCHTQKVAARIREEQQALEATKAPKDEPGAPAPLDASKGKASAKGTAAPAATGKVAAKKEVTVAVSRAVIEYRERIWRAIFSRVAQKADPMVNRALLLTLCVTQPHAIDQLALAKSLEKHKIGCDAHSHDLADTLSGALALSREQLAQAIHLIVANTNAQYLTITNVTRMLDVLKVSIEDHWMLQEDFLKLLTKNEIDALCDEIGIKAAMGKDYAKAIGGKKDEIIKSVLNVAGFEYKGKIPNSMRWKG